MRKFESAAAESFRPKVTKTDGYLDGRRQPLEQYEMVLFIFNSFLPQLVYLMRAISASLIMFCLFHCVLARLISGILKVKEM